MKKRNRAVSALLVTVLAAGLIVSGCGNTSDTDKGAAGKAESQEEKNDKEKAPEIAGLTFESQMKLDYAEVFNIYKYEDGYALIDVKDGDRYLVVPDGGSVPEDLDENIVILQKPLDHIYISATASMALFDAADALDHVRLSGTQSSGWYVEDARKAMESGDILFAGKYSEPDYELLISEDCDLALESTMIYHSPKVKEMIEDLDIPVFVDRSSYETHPFGRTEWVKLYGLLTDHEKEAEAFFEEQEKVIENLEDFENTEKTVAFFYIGTDGSVVVRRAQDYIPKMIKLAGGRYSFEDLETDGKGTTVQLTMEEFYATAQEADFLVYNGSVDDSLGSVQELLAKNELFADFKAVQEGNVWTTDKALYQSTDAVGQIILDFHRMLTGEDIEATAFLKKVE